MNSGGGSEIVLSHHDALSTSGLGSIAFNRGTANLATIDSACDGATDSANLKFRTTSTGGSITERMRISSDGKVRINSTSDLVTSGGKLYVSGRIECVEFDTNCAEFVRTDSGGNVIQIRGSGGSIKGSISHNNSNTSFNTSSDYRLKENVDYTFDATTRLKQLKPCRFNFIADETNTLVDGFLAHEAQAVVPECVTGKKDAVDADGNIDPQGIDQSKLVPLLVKTIQELEARITALEGA